MMTTTTAMSGSGGYHHNKPSWGQAIDKIMEYEDDDESVEYVYEEDDDDDEEEDDERDGARINAENDQENEAATREIEEDNTDEEVEDDEWSQVQDFDEDTAVKPAAGSAAQRDRPQGGEDTGAVSKGMKNLSISSVEEDVMSTTSSWSMLTNQTRDKKGEGGNNKQVIAAEAGEEYSLISAGAGGGTGVGTTGDGGASEDFSKITHPKLATMSYATRQTSAVAHARTTTSNESTATSPTAFQQPLPPANLVLPSAELANAMVSCPRCTMANLPGAQSCVACEMPLTANPQMDTDHQIALRLARIEEKNMETDLQSLLLDGTVQPSQASPKGPLQDVYRWANVILTELQTMSNTIQAPTKVCNVITTIPKDPLIEYLVKFHQQGQTCGNPLPTFGFLLTNRSPDQVIKDGATREPGSTYERNLERDSLLLGPEKRKTMRCGPLVVSADGGYDGPYPHQQVAYHKAEVPDYVWLVLLDKQKVRRGVGDALLVRDREEDTWQKCTKHNKHDLVWVADGAVPLLCTANANFRRPYKPRRNTTTTTTTTTKAAASGVQQEEDQSKEIYQAAYQKMRDAVVKAIDTTTTTTSATPPTK